MAAVKRAAAVLLTLLAVPAAACGASKTPLQIVRAASLATAKAHSSKASIVVKTAGSAGAAAGGDFSLTADGAFDYRSKAGRFISTVPRIGRVTLLIVGSTIYEQLPPAFASQFGGKPWLKIDSTEMGKLSGVDLSTLSQGQNDPTQALAFLRGASSKIATVGHEKVRGARTTHYRVDLDFAKAAAAAEPAQRPALQRVASLYAGQTVPADVWIDGAGRTRRMTYVVDLAKLHLPGKGAATPRSGTLSFTMELYEFGVAVKATPPPADQVTDLATVLTQARDGG